MGNYRYFGGEEDYLEENELDAGAEDYNAGGTNNVTEGTHTKFELSSDDDASLFPTESEQDEEDGSTEDASDDKEDADDDDEDDDDEDEPTAPLPEDFSKDYWTVHVDTIKRHHIARRTTLFDPSTATDLPIPLEFIDIFRETRTDIERQRHSSLATNDITDVWYRCPGVPPHDGLPEPWVGTTTFYLLGPNPGKGKTRICGRDTKNRTSDKPPHIWPEIWTETPQHDPFTL